MYDSLSQDDIEKNLVDIGCNEEQIHQFIHYFRENDITQMYKFLRSQRCYLLDRVHQEQKKVDYLDYLIYILKNR